MQVTVTIDFGKVPRFVERVLSQKKLLSALVLGALVTPVALYAVTKPYTFSPGDTIESAKINANFDAIFTELNRQAGVATGLHEELMPTSCDTDSALGGVAGTESAFCIEKNERSATSYYEAVNTCAGLGRHVCTQNQFWIGTKIAGVANMCNNWEWVGDRDDANSSGHLQVVMGGNGCIIQSWAWAGQHANGNGSQPYRCCQGGISGLFD